MREIPSPDRHFHLYQKQPNRSVSSSRPGVLYYRFFLHADKTERIPHLTALRYRSLFLLTGALLSGVNAAIFWFCLMWFVAGTGLPQMWIGAHLVTLVIGFVLSFGISVVQAEHIPEVIYRACQLGSKALFLIPLSTGFRAISDSLLPSSPLTIGRLEMSSVDVFTFATALAIALYLLFAIMIWLAEKRSEAGEGN